MSEEEEQLNQLKQAWHRIFQMLPTWSEDKILMQDLTIMNNFMVKFHKEHPWVLEK